MIKILHPIAGGLALSIVMLFWISTALSELFLGTEAVVTVKTLIPYGFIILIPALAAAGGSGFSMRRRGALVAAKARRMPIIAANGVLVLIPSALFLAMKAGAGEFDVAFYAVQAVELVAGAVNIALLGLNMRDGLRLRGRRVAAV